MVTSTVRPAGVVELDELDAEVVDVALLVGLPDDVGLDDVELDDVEPPPLAGSPPPHAARAVTRASPAAYDTARGEVFVTNRSLGGHF
jgi:hypothetical protein